MFNHIIKLASHSANTQMEVLDRASRNLANMNTSGYKSVRFENYLMPGGQVEGTDRVDYGKGTMALTQRELDIAVDGFGFIPVTQPDGTTAYTRDGSFALNSEGFIVTNRGDLVGDGIQVPPNYQKILIEKDGVVKVVTTDEMHPEQVGRLVLVRFTNPEGLENIGYNKLVATDQSGEPMIDNDSRISQGHLERSNTNMYAQIDQILRLNATMVANMRVIRFSDDLFRQSVNLRQ